MSSRINEWQAQQQQAGNYNTPSVPHSTASTSKFRMGNGVTSQQSSFGVQGGSRSEPPRARPSYPAPSTVVPDDSISVRGSQTISDRQTRSNVDRNINEPNDVPRMPSAPKPAGASQGVRQAAPQTFTSSFGRGPYGNQNQTPSSSFGETPRSSGNGIPQHYWPYTPSTSNQQEPSSPARSSAMRGNEQAASSQRSAPTATNNQDRPIFSGSNAPNNVCNVDPPAPSTARVANQQPSGVAQSFTGETASRSRTGMSTGGTGQNYAAAPYNGPPNSTGHQVSPGISIGAPPSGPFHFHYNQVDNRQMTINNNAPGHVTKNNNHFSSVDNRNHDNTHAPQANTYRSHAANVGNTHTDVHQCATSGSRSASSSSYPRRETALPPSESMPIRDRQYKRERHVKAGLWRQKVIYETVPDDRPC